MHNTTQHKVKVKAQVQVGLNRANGTHNTRSTVRREGDGNRGRGDGNSVEPVD
jgi:hypothetical protein